MPFAGTTSIFSFKYSLLIDIVTKLKLALIGRSLSAGNNFINNKIDTSETLRNETIKNTELENVKSISVHVPTHLKPLNEDQFGHYLAGLIDGDGHFSKKTRISSCF